jgi:hypothetical protein
VDTRAWSCKGDKNSKDSSDNRQLNPFPFYFLFYFSMTTDRRYDQMSGN